MKRTTKDIMNLNEKIIELLLAHDEWMNEDAGGARLHEAVMAFKGEVQPERGTERDECGV